MTAESIARRRALTEMAVLTSVLAQVPGKEHRGFEFWTAVRDVVCERNGIESLNGHATKQTVIERIERAERRAEEVLTEKHRKILTLLAEGLTVQEISTRLVCDYYTIKSALARIYKLLDVQNGTHAVAVAMREGLIPHPEEEESSA